jgi:response regulator of citrate/malate metabolism
MFDLNEIVAEEDSVKKSFKLGETTYFLKPMTKDRTDRFMAISTRNKERIENNETVSIHEMIAEQLNILVGMPYDAVYELSLNTAKKILTLVLEQANLMGEQKDGISESSSS